MVQSVLSLSKRPDAKSYLGRIGLTERLAADGRLRPKADVGPRSALRPFRSLTFARRDPESGRPFKPVVFALLRGDRRAVVLIVHLKCTISKSSN